MSATSPVSPGRRSNARNLARIVFTVAPFLADHLWRRCRIDETTLAVERLSEPAPLAAADDTTDDSAVQTARDGRGPLVMRTYEVRIQDAELAPAELLRRLLERPGDLNDDRIAGFVRDDRPATDLVVGDELVVELPGPWNGPVRVARANESELLLQTLNGHMEAGQIRFDTIGHSERPDGLHDFTFRIRSWARGGNPTFTILHLGLPVAKELQTAMWVAMCDGATRVSGGRREGSIRVITEMLEASTPDGDRMGDALELVRGR